MMHHYRLFIAAIIVSIAFAFTRTHHDVVKPVPTKGFALIELYTSEGCSSCPSADKLVAKIAQEFKDKDVYVLAYHVDYWNRLGWKDVFSSPQYSARQREYSDYLKLNGVYTPQAVVNGRTEFVGSDDSRMHAAIQQSLAKSNTAELDLNNIKINGNKAELTYKVSGASNSSLMLAVIKNHAQSQVKSGENSGRLLSHINIVQKLQSINLKNDAGNAGIDLPEGFNPRDWSIVGFVQSNRNGEIVAVQKAIFDKANI
jgi:hypothetical protein